MRLKSFVDASGEKWVVWAEAPDGASADPSVGILFPELRRGSLMFESEREIRRLSPYPDDWAVFSWEGLNDLCTMARRTPFSPRGARGHRDELSRSA